MTPPTQEMTKGSVYECFNPTDSWLLHFKKKYSIKVRAGVPLGSDNCQLTCRSALCIQSGNGGQTLAEQAMRTGPAPPASEPDKVGKAGACVPPYYTTAASPLLSTAGRPWAPPPDYTFGQTRLCRAVEHSEHSAVGESPVPHPLMPPLPSR